MYGVTCRVTKMLDRFERRAVERLLSESGLVYEGTPDYTALAEDGDENVIATASLSGSVIKMVAASSEWRDAGLSGQVISALMNTARADGRHKFFIYTKPEGRAQILSARLPRARRLEKFRPNGMRRARRERIPRRARSGAR